MKKRVLLSVLFTTICMALGCSAPKVNLFSEDTDPLKEYVLQGEAAEKVLVIPVQGVISDTPRKGFLQPKPSMVQEVVSQLQRAQKDKRIRAVIFKIDSPGGSTTASDILYREIMDYKKRTGVKVIAAMMDVAASGGYYVSLPADHILAHPTTVTGSVGVIFIYPQIEGLMDKVGLAVQVNKSGKNKDMGSPFRAPTDEERAIIENITEELGSRFVQLVKENRRLPEKAIEQIATARIFISRQALKLGLIDAIGYLPDAVAKAKSLAGIDPDAQVVVYRRAEFPDDTLYNTSQSVQAMDPPVLIDLGLFQHPAGVQPGFHYLWMPGGAH